MKMYKRYYLITVTDKKGKVVHTQEEFSGNSASEEMMMLSKEFPGHEITSKFFQEEI